MKFNRRPLSTTITPSLQQPTVDAPSLGLMMAMSSSATAWTDDLYSLSISCDTRNKAGNTLLFYNDCTFLQFAYTQVVLLAQNILVSCHNPET